MEKDFAEIIRELMAERNLKQQALADILGIRQSQISNWLNGRSLPGYHSLRLLCEKLDVDSKRLFSFG